MEIAHFGRELLYAVSLSGGLGSNQVGLDRGQPGPAEIIVFERVGPKVLVVARNYRFRASSGNAAERQAVADSFPSSVLWGFSVEAEEGERVLVDATPFFLRDAHGVGARLRAARQGSFTVDESRSAVYLPRTKGFAEEHGGGGHADLHERRARGARSAVDCAVGTGGDRARASRARGGARRGLRAAAVRSARRRAAAHVLRLRHADHCAARAAVDRAPPAAEEGPRGGDVGADRAHRLLRRQRRARGRAPRARRGCRVVERGIRGGRVHRRLPGTRAARRCRSDGRAVQRHQLGPPHDARVVVRQQRRRSAHGRDREGRRHARFPACAAERADWQRSRGAVGRCRRGA